jgi:hypothetical protein
MTTKVVVSQPKFVLKSMSIWGAIMQVISMGVAVVGPIADATGYSNPVQPGDIETIGNTGMAVIGGLGTLIGAFFGIWGRFRAGKSVQPVSIIPNAAPVMIEVVQPPAIPKATG